MEKLDPLKSTPFALIPKHLEVEERPELSVFPLNIAFVSLANINGVDTSGQAVYYPDLETFEDKKRYEYMRYLNLYGNQDYIDLWYFKESGAYEGVKFIGGEQYSKAIGANWQVFFVHLTSVGLGRGERCIFKPIDK